MTAYFITGTDTEVGKTFITCAFLEGLKARGRRAIGMKPVAAGLEADGRNDDVVRLMAAASVAAPLEQINPFALRQPMAPHLAAAADGRVIRFAPIHAAFNALRLQADVVLVEGVGGFRVPLGPEGDSADLAETLGLPVILVVGLRLGCLNHALLTADAISTRKLRLAGWVANTLDPAMAGRDDNVATLAEALMAGFGAPLLGDVPAIPGNDARLAAGYLQLPSLDHRA